MIRLAAHHPEWVLGFADEVWWSRLAHPALHGWSEREPLRLAEVPTDKTDPDPKALACYGLLRADTMKIWLRFVAGRPVSVITLRFLGWVLQQLEQEGKKALLLVWDNASWHISHAVRSWLRAHNQKVKKDGGVRIIVCQLPTKSPWLNRIEPYGVHGKRAVVEPTRTLTAGELSARVCDYYNCEHFPHLSK